MRIQELNFKFHAWIVSGKHFVTSTINIHKILRRLNHSIAFKRKIQNVFDWFNLLWYCINVFFLWNVPVQCLLTCPNIVSLLGKLSGHILISKPSSYVISMLWRHRSVIRALIPVKTMEYFMTLVWEFGRQLDKVSTYYYIASVTASWHFGTRHYCTVIILKTKVFCAGKC